MTQIDLLPEIKTPERGGQLFELLMEMKRRPITLWVAMQELHIGAFSRRICDLRQMGWPVKDRWIKTGTGKTVKEFWID